MLSNEKQWIIILEGNTENSDDDIVLKFTDTSLILGEPTINRGIMDEIYENIKKYEHYTLFNNIKVIKNEKGEDLSKYAIWLLLGIVSKNSQRVGLLFGSLPDDELHIIACWPNILANQLRGDPSILDAIIDNLVSDPYFWEQVDLIITSAHKP